MVTGKGRKGERKGNRNDKIEYPIGIGGDCRGKEILLITGRGRGKEKKQGKEGKRRRNGKGKAGGKGREGK